MDAKQNISSIRHFLKKRHWVSDVFAGMCLLVAEGEEVEEGHRHSYRSIPPSRSERLPSAMQRSYRRPRGSGHNRGRGDGLLRAQQKALPDSDSNDVLAREIARDVEESKRFLAHMEEGYSLGEDSSVSLSSGDRRGDDGRSMRRQDSVRGGTLGSRGLYPELEDVGIVDHVRLEDDVVSRSSGALHAGEHSSWGVPRGGDGEGGAVGLELAVVDGLPRPLLSSVLRQSATDAALHNMNLGFRAPSSSSFFPHTKSINSKAIPRGYTLTLESHDYVTHIDPQQSLRARPKPTPDILDDLGYRSEEQSALVEPQVLVHPRLPVSLREAECFVKSSRVAHRVISGYGDDLESGSSKGSQSGSQSNSLSRGLSSRSFSSRYGSEDTNSYVERRAYQDRRGREVEGEAMSDVSTGATGSSLSSTHPNIGALSAMASIGSDVFSRDSDDGAVSRVGAGGANGGGGHSDDESVFSLSDLQAHRDLQPTPNGNRLKLWRVQDLPISIMNSISDDRSVSVSASSASDL